MEPGWQILFLRSRYQPAPGHLGFAGKPWIASYACSKARASDEWRARLVAMAHSIFRCVDSFCHEQLCAFRVGAIRANDELMVAGMGWRGSLRVGLFTRFQMGRLYLCPRSYDLESAT